MTPENFLLLVLACLAVNLSPGPSVLLVSSVSAARGFRAGLFAVLGMTAGAFIHVLLAASGVAALLAASPGAFAVVQYLGAAWLIYLGLELLIARRSARDVGDAKTVTERLAWQFFRRGLLVDALNPKIALFFLAFIPPFLQTVANPGFLASLMLGSVFLATSALVNAALAWMVAAGSTRARGSLGLWVRRRIPGAVLILLGLRLLWQADPADWPDA